MGSLDLEKLKEFKTDVLLYCLRVDMKDFLNLKCYKFNFVNQKINT